MAIPKAELNTNVATYFPTQTSGAISPADMRFISTGIIHSMVNYASGGYLKIDPVITGALASGLEPGMVVWNTGTQQIFFWAGTGFRQIAFV